MDSQKVLKEFHRIAEIQGWSPLHTPNNLAQALAVEVGELLQVMQDDGAESVQQRDASEFSISVAHELADVQMYLLVLAESLGVNLEEAVERKQAYNRDRFEKEDAGSHE